MPLCLERMSGPDSMVVGNPIREKASQSQAKKCETTKSLNSILSHPLFGGKWKDCNEKNIPSPNDLSGRRQQWQSSILNALGSSPAAKKLDSCRGEYKKALFERAARKLELKAYLAAECLLAYEQDCTGIECWAQSCDKLVDYESLPHVLEREEAFEMRELEERRQQQARIRAGQANQLDEAEATALMVLSSGCEWNRLDSTSVMGTGLESARSTELDLENDKHRRASFESGSSGTLATPITGASATGSPHSFSSNSTGRDEAHGNSKTHNALETTGKDRPKKIRRLPGQASIKSPSLAPQPLTASIANARRFHAHPANPNFSRASGGASMDPAGSGGSSEAPDEMPSMNTNPSEERLETEGLDGPRPGLPGKACNCRKSFCLKKYCGCFTESVYCDSSCKCLNCKNIAGHRKDIMLARARVIAKEPEAFKPKSNKRLTCKCKRTRCLKMYCDCFAGDSLMRDNHTQVSEFHRSKNSVISEASWPSPNIAAPDSLRKSMAISF